ncbi:MAG: hypothetical protein QM765_32720 [Myxococcales bacterium]
MNTSLTLCLIALAAAAPPPAPAQPASPAAAGAGTAASAKAVPVGIPAGPTSVEAMPYGLMRPHQDAWYVSDVHQRYKSEVVFSRVSIEPPRELEERFASTFARRDSLYGRVYLERSLANTPIAVPGLRPIFPPESGYFVRMFVDGKPFDGGAGVLHGALRLSSSPEEDRQLTTWRFDLHPAAGDEEPTELSLAWARAVNKLKPGRRRIRLEVWGGDLQQHSRTPRAVGELLLNVGKDDFVGSGRRAPREGYQGHDKEPLRAAVQPLFSQTRPPLKAEKVSLLKVWSQRLEPGVRHVLAAGREADPDGDRVCEWKVIQVRQDGSPGAWRATRLEECRAPECVPVVADCD